MVSIAAKHLVVHLSQEGLCCSSVRVVGRRARTAEEIFFCQHCSEGTGGAALEPDETDVSDPKTIEIAHEGVDYWRPSLQLNKKTH